MLWVCERNGCGVRSIVILFLLWRGESVGERGERRGEMEMERQRRWGKNGRKGKKIKKNEKKRLGWGVWMGGGAGDDGAAAAADDDDGAGAEADADDAAADGLTMC